LDFSMFFSSALNPLAAMFPPIVAF